MTAISVRAMSEKAAAGQGVDHIEFVYYGKG
jgi:hypothetical protein